MYDLGQCYYILGDPSGPLKAPKSPKNAIFGPEIGVRASIRGLLWLKGAPDDPKTCTTMYPIQID